MGNPIVQLTDITKKYRGAYALKQCNLELERGKIYGLVGKNGAGKTTMMRVIAGLSVPTSGTVEKATEHMGTLIETPALNGNMTIRENLNFYRKIYGKEEDTYSDEELLGMVGLEDTGKKKVKDFSLGMRQRLGIAVALIGKPEFLMLDEPVNGLDPIGVVEIRNLVKELSSKQGMTILISSHNLSELYQTATDYIIIDNGVIKKEISQEELEKKNISSLEEYFLSIIQ